MIINIHARMNTVLVREGTHMLCCECKHLYQTSLVVLIGLYTYQTKGMQNGVELQP